MSLSHSRLDRRRSVQTVAMRTKAVSILVGIAGAVVGLIVADALDLLLGWIIGGGNPEKELAFEWLLAIPLVLMGVVLGPILAVRTLRRVRRRRARGLVVTAE